MRIQANSFSIAEIRDMYDRGDLVINNMYQRHSGIWPTNAKSYFIDSILTSYPFPKIYIQEVLDRKTKKIRREIVDGQQRVTTIISFLKNEFRLTATSKLYNGMYYSDLSEQLQIDFLSYSVPIDMVLAADRAEILEMFRRMNSYTVPLNPAEKRHSQFMGEFKWFVNELADQYSPMLVEFGVVTQKQALRMGDAEILTELCQLLIKGIVNKQETALRNLYKEFDETFVELADIKSMIVRILDFIRESLGDSSNSFLFKGYVFYSLFAALAHNRFAVPSLAQQIEGASIGAFWLDAAKAKNGLLTLASAHEGQDTDGQFKYYVEACLSTTHRVAQRRTRAKWLLKALNDEL
jgi:hypothetical protein